MTEVAIIPVKAPIIGTDGKPLVVVKRDRSDIHDLEQYQNITQRQLLMAAGRMLRDGKSLRQIRTELNLIDSGEYAVPLSYVENAAVLGLQMLNADIEAGLEPEETISHELMEQADVEAEKLIDSDLIDPTGVNNVDAGYLQDMS